MRSGGNNFNYFPENKLTKLANLVQFRRRRCLCCLEDCGGGGLPTVPSFRPKSVGSRRQFNSQLRRRPDSTRQLSRVGVVAVNSACIRWCVFVRVSTDSDNIRCIVLLTENVVARAQTTEKTNSATIHTHTRHDPALIWYNTSGLPTGFPASSPRLGRWYVC